MRCGDAEEVGAGGEVREVEVAGGPIVGYTAASIVEEVDLHHLVGFDGEGSDGGVGIDVDGFERVGLVDAHTLDGEHEDDDAVAPLLGVSDKEVLAALVIDVAVPCVGVGGGVVNGVAGAVVDGEVEGDGAVAALGVES